MTLICSVYDKVCKITLLFLKVLVLYLFLYGEVRNFISLNLIAS
jgi:hypothetical protein